MGDGAEVPVILLERPEPASWQRQAAACAPYLIERGYRIVGKVQTHADAFALVFNGAAKVVVAASAADDDDRLRALLAQVKGKLEIARASRPQKPAAGNGHGHDTEDIVIRMASRGAPTDVIAQYWGLAEDRVRQILDRVRRRK